MVISVIIPCRNEVKFINECIEAIFNNVFIEKTELNVFVVDGMSDDGTRELILTLQSRFPSLHLVENEKQLTPFAFNLGIKSQKADFYQIVGARQIISQNYIQDGILKIIDNPEIWCIGGLVENVFTDINSEIIAKAMGTSFGMGLGNFRIQTESSFVDTVGTPLYPNHVFEKIGYFDEELVRNQDDDMNYRVSKAGGKIFFNAEISLKYYVRTKIDGLWRQFYQYGYWKVFVNKKHKAITTYRQLVPPLFVLYCLLSPLILFLGINFFLLIMTPVFLYLLVSILVSFQTSSKLKETPKIIIIFPILHFSYGFGYLNGIIDFLILNKKPDKKQERLSR